MTVSNPSDWVTLEKTDKGRNRDDKIKGGNGAFRDARDPVRERKVIIFCTTEWDCASHTHLLWSTDGLQLSGDLGETLDARKGSSAAALNRASCQTISRPEEG